ncbi:hypothetical protein LCGC14_0629690 [marine sediment metagenome]|uniref:DUF4129 domain-containing protein n=1 Tax=marine sediment metagenome TaxID=412755 RepID=A0A0F9TNS4_9ZZZZ
MLRLRIKDLRKLNQILLFLILLIITTSVSINRRVQINNSNNSDNNVENNKIPKASGAWAKLTLLNTLVNDTDHYHNDTIRIEGNLTEYINTAIGINNYNVYLYVDGIKLPQFNNKTHRENSKDGYFNISFIIPFNISVYQTHRIEVNVTDDLGLDFVELQNFFTFNLFPKYRINLTNNYEVNNTDHYHNDTISIKGRIYEYFSMVSYPDAKLNVSIFIDGLKYKIKNETSNDMSNFTITFKIPWNLTVALNGQSHLIEVNITDGDWESDTRRENNFTIDLYPKINLTLTNTELQYTQHYHDEVIAIQGRASEYLNYNIGLSGYTVSLYIDGQLESDTGVTNSTGMFQIDYTISFDLNINQTHTIAVDIIQGPYNSSRNDIVVQNSFIISLVPYIRINLTNTNINNSYNYQNEVISIQGKVYEYLNYANGVSGQNVSLYIDGQLKSAYAATTDSNGNFQIDYTIPSTFVIYQAYKIEVNITTGIFINESVLDNYFIFHIKQNSTLEIDYFDFLPKIPGETFNVVGILRFDNLLGAGISNVQINYIWYNATFQWSVNSFFTRATDGSFSENLRIPTNAYSSIINLYMSFPGDLPNIGPSYINITNIKLFSNITVNWNIVSKAKEGDNITIAGRVVSFTNDSLLIVNRSIIIRYEGIQIGTNITDENGDFIFMYIIPGGTGNMTIKIELVTSGTITLDSVIIVNVTAVPFVPISGTTTPPFLIFSLVFFPILIGIVVILAVFGYRYYKKQEKESRVVRVELDSKILNLKILKDSGRLEESLSYLFNAIFMSLIDAKYNRTRKENETIRDFAIVSVKELKLTPAAIYPFIQKVEEIIYGKPFKITDNEFYKTCELFSPLYFELTGNNFILNF